MKKSLMFAAIIAAVVILALMRRGATGNETAVTLETLSLHEIRASILASGKLSNEEEVMLSTEVIGKVSALHVEEGDAVTEGQLLLQIDDEAPRALVGQQQASVRIQEVAIAAAKLKLDNLQLAWNRKKMLHERGLLTGGDDAFESSTNELDLARLDIQSREAALQQARAILAEAEKNLAKTRVYSPLTGIVTSLNIKVGETAISSTTNVPGSSLMTIANPASINTEVNVDEADIANVQVGQEAEIVAIAYPNQPMKGVVRSIAVSAKQSAGSQSLSFVVKIGFTDTAGVLLRPGMSSRAEIFTHTGDATLALPIQAIRLTEDTSTGLKQYHAFRAENGVARKVVLKVGISDDSYQEVVEGLKAGDKIITGPDRALRNLEDGDAITESAPAAKAA
ncbi:MAG: efflux RND transporter periplasmic adaptor subunit [Pseudomonadales bacterium]|jgi:HlyD family secretion protein|nr:efflux RND transporter periplasmic adaptor subunit [Pseudomonadales bacterium]